MAVSIRRIVPEDWAAARDQRLEALADPAAPVAFLDTLEVAGARPDQFWIDRARNGASGDYRFQLLAEDDGRLVGTVAVLAQEAGERDYFGAVVGERRAVLIGVYVSPAARGAGVLDSLVESACGWAREQGFDRIELDVHADNPRARAAYARLGFALTGHDVETALGRELQMARAL
ncbi:GNAT family N-acetyltransferase [Demequina rhizosphaerae]|uniref:GNAT family N-acetyltransferase n=1 Tax=Demequina rhizosphaerae TaxID=1638985 RepID=UPI000781BF34|nr:GNAT family N-acetyltransferase [Demequina rhizosphaerae]